MPRQWQRANRTAVVLQSSTACCSGHVPGRPLRWSSFFESERERERAREQEYEVERDQQLQEWPRFGRRPPRQQRRRRLRRTIDYGHKKRETQHRQQQLGEARV